MIVEKHVTAPGVATAYVATIGDRKVEFAESLQPPLTIEKKWILTISCLYGCPVKCKMCDAGGRYYGRLPKEEILAQTDWLVYRRYPDGVVPAEKFKIQFARMGEPAFNPFVLDALREFQRRYTAPGLIPSLSTIGPVSGFDFLEQVRRIKEEVYPEGKFQMQFSVHTTDDELRTQLIPTPTLTLHQIADWGGDYFRPGDRKVTLNFIVMQDYPIDPEMLAEIFNPDNFAVKLTPLNPTATADRNGLITALTPVDNTRAVELSLQLRDFGFDTIVSIGAPEENSIGSNCGQLAYATASESSPDT